MKPKSKREKYATRKFLLGSDKVREQVLAVVRNLPIDPLRPLEVVVREEQKQRKLDQNAAYWAGPLRDISEQAFVEGRRFAPEVLHEYFKREFLFEDEPPPDPKYVKDGYRKWDYDPSGERVLIGSTTMLTVAGFAVFMEQVHAFGASLGVRFHANPREVP